MEKKPTEKVKKDKKVVDETPERDEPESSKFVSTVKFAPEVKAYKPKVPFAYSMNPLFITDKSQIYENYPYILSVLYCLSPILGIFMCVFIL